MGLGELDVLDYIAMTAAVEQFKYGNETRLVDFFCPGPAQRINGEAFAYDIEKASANVATPKASDAPSKRVALAPMGQVAGRCIVVAEHKMLPGALLAGLREPGTRRTNAQAQIARELRDLDRRRARFRNLAVAQMLTGTLTIAEDDVKAAVDYKVAGTHKPTAQASWATAETDIPADLDAWIDLVEKDSGFTPTHAWCNRSVMKYLMNNTKVKDFLGTADYKAQIGRDGYITSFHGLTWHIYGATYTPKGGSATRYILDDKVILAPDPTTDWVDLLEGSTMILPLGETQLQEVFGMHAYTVLKADPAGYQITDGDVFIPRLKVPDAIIYADVTP